MIKESQQKILNMISYAKNPKVSYGGTKYEYGYHSLDIGELLIKGQRNITKRISLIPYNFKNKTVLDIGCGPGGMLHALSNVINYGVGIDRDYKQINVANAVKDINSEYLLHFYVMDLINEPLTLIQDFLMVYKKVDVCFFLSLAKWISNWTEVLKYCKSISNTLIFESNGKDQQQQKQENFIKKVYNNVKLISKTSDDDPKQKNRRLYICG